MTPERWQAVAESMEKALRLKQGDRSAYLAQLALQDPDLHGEVESLLRSHDGAGTDFLKMPAVQISSVASSSPSDAMIGRRVGAYQIVERIGLGGMGEVYRAFRADDEYRKQVALKVIRPGQDSSFVVGRFKNERQILASLDHPNIARLLDGGTTEDGAPYFVMELIAGEPIDQYCNQHELSIPARLNLFVQACSAVQYAHQRLIIHRDLKPGNILVTADGTPKLLDFGIAKILDTDALAHEFQPTLTAFRMLTPGYASPEQVKDQPITTASDVYSLGVVLYELLTGFSPYRVTTRSPQELAQAVCEFEPEKPSTAVRRSIAEMGVGDEQSPEPKLVRDGSPEKLVRLLRGDLDNIVLMALRKEPPRRYASAEQFAADIRRHLEDLPVTARKDTVRYRTSKFVARHKAGVLAAALVAAILVIALIVTVREARIARQQAELARQQSVRAERRFNDVRKLANSLMFDVYDSIRDLPGSTKARQLIADKALEYLDSLSQESSGDPGLQRELAGAYDRVGEVLGYEGAANLGDHTRSAQSIAKALAIRESLVASHPADLNAQKELGSEYWRMMFALQSLGDFDRALEISQRALPLAQRMAAADKDPESQHLLAGFYWLTGSVLLAKGDGAGALRNCREGAEVRERISGDAQTVAFAHMRLVADYNCIAKALAMTGELDQAIAMAAKATSMNEQVVQAYPSNATLQGYMAQSYDIWADLLFSKGDLSGAWNLYHRSHAIFEDLSSKDSSDRMAAGNISFTELSMGRVLVRQGRIQEGLQRAQAALLIAQRGDPKDLWTATLLSMCYSDMGAAYFALADRATSSSDKVHDLQEARSWYAKAQDVWTPIPNHGSVDGLGNDQIGNIRTELAKANAALAQFNGTVHKQRQ